MVTSIKKAFNGRPNNFLGVTEEWNLVSIRLVPETHGTIEPAKICNLCYYTGKENAHPVSMSKMCVYEVSWFSALCG